MMKRLICDISRSQRLLSISRIRFSTTRGNAGSRSSKGVIGTLRDQLELSEEAAREIYILHKTQLDIVTAHKLSDRMKLLLKEGIRKEIMLQYHWILTIDLPELSHKLGILREMQPRDLNDYVPLLKINTPDLNRLRQRFAREKDIVPGGNRIYYLSDKLQVLPHEAAATLSSYFYLARRSLERFFKNIDLFLEYKLSPADILSDPRAINDSPSTARTRMEFAKEVNHSKLMPWMVRASKSGFERSMRLEKEKQEVLGDSTSSLEYLSRRLGCSVEEMETHLKNYPAVLKIRPPKLKVFLDFLLNEAGFSEDMILRNPKVFTAKLETCRTRLRELRDLGVTEVNATPFCYSKKQFEAMKNRLVKQLRKTD